MRPDVNLSNLIIGIYLAVAVAWLVVDWWGRVDPSPEDEEEG